MPRTKRITYPGGFYHVYNRGLNKQKIFFSSIDYSKFLAKLFALKTELKLIIYSYVLMPNHFHFLIEEGSAPLAKVFGRLLTSYAVYFNKKYQKRGPVFEDRYKSILIQKDNYFLSLSRYIHLNPVKTKLCQDPFSYPYSSLPEIVNKNKKKTAIISHKHITRLIGNKANDIKSYIKFIYEGIDKDLSKYNPWKHKREVLGSKRFTVNRIIKNSKSV